MFEVYLEQVFVIVLLFSGVPLIAVSVVGVVASIVQSSTQIQEQTITYVIKLATLAGVMFLVSGWVGSEILAFFQDILLSISELGNL